MSTFILDDEHINALLGAASTYGERVIDLNCQGQWVTFDRAGYTRLGQILKATNVASFNRTSIDVDSITYKYRAPRQHREPVEILKAIACYEYQACETPDWDASIAKAFCAWLRVRAIEFLPGYEDAEWGIDAPEPSTPAVIWY